VSDTVSLFVVIGTFVNIIGVLWLLWWTRKHRGESAATTETTGHVWDGDLTEYNKPLPRWWLGLFLLTVAFSLAYLALYPGLGNFAGTRGWSQESQLREEVRQAEARLAKTFAPFEGRSVDELRGDPAAARIGRNLFLNNCAACHGSDGRGAPGFPNLADSDWLWGGSAERVLESIRDGREGVMMPWGPVLGTRGLEDVLAYVSSLSGRPLPAGDAAAGGKRFLELCSACHGQDGKGSALVGAPNLADQAWLHGGSVAAMRESISAGRHGQMPAHLERLGETRTRLLAAYVLGLDGASD
jgi:cytochrome c oxidase cbb3-type subunit 3